MNTGPQLTGCSWPAGAVDSHPLPVAAVPAEEATGSNPVPVTHHCPFAKGYCLPRSDG